jgi:hypothetical protein
MKFRSTSSAGFTISNPAILEFLANIAASTQLRRKNSAILLNLYIARYTSKDRLTAQDWAKSGFCKHLAMPSISPQVQHSPQHPGSLALSL